MIKTKSFDDESTARKAAEKLIASKKKKGYYEVSDEESSKEIEMSSRSEVRKWILKQGKFSESILRSLTFAYGEDADSLVEVIERKMDRYEVFDISLCKGDLVIEGLLDDAPNDFSLLIVLGDLHVADAILAGEVFVIGDMIVDGALVCGSSGDQTLSVGGNLCADELVIVDHNLIVDGATTSEFKYERGVASDQLAVLCFDDDGEPDLSVIAGLVRDGYRLFDS